MNQQGDLQYVHLCYYFLSQQRRLFFLNFISEKSRDQKVNPGCEQGFEKFIKMSLVRFNCSCCCCCSTKEIWNVWNCTKTHNTLLTLHSKAKRSCIVRRAFYTLSETIYASYLLLFFAIFNLFCLCEANWTSRPNRPAEADMPSSVSAPPPSPASQFVGSSSSCE